MMAEFQTVPQEKRVALKRKVKDYFVSRLGDIELVTMRGSIRRMAFRTRFWLTLSCGDIRSSRLLFLQVRSAWQSDVFILKWAASSRLGSFPRSLRRHHPDFERADHRATPRETGASRKRGCAHQGKNRCCCGGPSSTTCCCQRRRNRRNR
ncbi:hypothetical protein BC830DRAFT_923464 [Chytriomyces sp. MP71]|nr:hypothetical protein BC830DRAFT_923464 [Chytriomyces sp. MP71]